MVYLNNFPSQNALKGQEFKGSKELESELFKRGIIGDGEITIVNVNADSNEKVEALEKALADSNEKVEALEKALADSNEKVEALEKEKADLELKLKNATEALAKVKTDNKKTGVAE